MMNEGVIVACLCAAWCRLCDDYAPVLRAVGAEFEGLRVEWIDIEDEADLVGDVDVETFPMIVIIGPEGPRFAGPLTPQPETLRRLLRATSDRVMTCAAQSDPAVLGFAQRLRART